MYGWIHEAIRSLIIERFGGEAKWHEICANVKHPRRSTLNPDELAQDLTEVNRHHTYTDATTVAIVVQIAELLQVEVNVVLETFGDYFVERYAHEHGFTGILKCLGSNLYDFLKNVNILHFHLQKSVPNARFPEMFVTQLDFQQSTFVLVYHSIRGTLLLPVLSGMVKCISRLYFDIKVDTVMLTEPDKAPGLLIKLQGTSLSGRSRFIPITYDTISRRLTDDAQELEFAQLTSPSAFTRHLLVMLPFHLIFDSQLKLLGCGRFLKRYLNHHRGQVLPKFSTLDGKAEWNWESLSLDRKHQFEFKVPDCKIPPIHGALMFVAATATTTEPPAKRISLTFAKTESRRASASQLPAPPQGVYFFMGSPSLAGVKSLQDYSMTLADVPSWDLTREFVMMCEHFREEVAHSAAIGNKLFAVKQGKKIALENDLSAQTRKKIAWRVMTVSINIMLNLVQIGFNARGAVRIRQTEVETTFCNVYTSIVVISSVFLAGIVIFGRIPEAWKLSATYRANKVYSSVYAAQSDRITRSEMENEMLMLQQIKIMKIQCITAVSHDLPMIILVVVAIHRSFQYMDSIFEPLFMSLFSLIFGFGAKLLSGLEMFHKKHALQEWKLERALHLLSQRSDRHLLQSHRDEH